MKRGAGGLRVPRSEGLNLRLPGRPFHGDPELFIQESGSLHFEFPEQRVLLRAGEILLVPAGLPHGERWCGRFLNVIAMIQPDGFSLHIGHLERGQMRCGPADRFLANVEPITGYAAELAATSDAPAEVGLRQGLLLALLCRLRLGLEGSSPGPTVEPPLLRRCEALINAHYARLDFSVQWLADNLKCSADHLSRLFRQQHRKRLLQHVHERRIARARELLRSSTLGVAEIAWACGYASPSYFNRMFLRLTGTTPREFAVSKIGADPRP